MKFEDVSHPRTPRLSNIILISTRVEMLQLLIERNFLGKPRFLGQPVEKCLRFWQLDEYNYTLS